MIFSAICAFEMKFYVVIWARSSFSDISANEFIRGFSSGTVIIH